jgi:DNA-binding NarL/FixJ family response regulator
MNVLVVDSHSIYRRGLVASLRLLAGVDAVDDADGAESAREHPALNGAEVVFVDPSIAGGADFMTALGATTTARVIACSSHCDDASVRSALEAGAAGYLRKDTLNHDVLQAALAAALAGASVVALGALGGTLRAGVPAGRPPQAAEAPETPLSPREQRVLALIADGHPTREVAAELCYSERTVKNVLHDIVTKLNARSRSHAIAHAVRAGFI